MTRPLYMPIRRVGLRVENGAGWWVRCACCTAIMILINGDVKVAVPHVCPTCKPSDGPIEDAAPEHARRCDREAQASERRAAKSRERAAEARAAGHVAVAAANDADAERATTWAQSKRLEAEAWRKTAETRRTA